MASVAANVPGDGFWKWPADSSDLSPTETVWTYMVAELRIDYKSDVEELKECLERFRQSMPLYDLKALFDGMENRVSLCIDVDGET